MSQGGRDVRGLFYSMETIMKRLAPVIAILALSSIACFCGGMPAARPKQEKPEEPRQEAKVAAIRASSNIIPPMKKEPRPREAVPEISHLLTPELFIKRFGNPDEDWGNDRIANRPAKDELRRFLVYKKESVTVVYSANDFEFPVRVWNFKEYKHGLAANRVVLMMGDRDAEKGRLEREYREECLRVEKANEDAHREYLTAVKAADDKEDEERAEAELARLESVQASQKKAVAQESGTGPSGDSSGGTTSNGSIGLFNGAKTVQVRGYTNKNGVYVPPHTRSLPRR